MLLAMLVRTLDFLSSSMVVSRPPPSPWLLLMDSQFSEESGMPDENRVPCLQDGTTHELDECTKELQTATPWVQEVYVDSL